MVFEAKAMFFVLEQFSRLRTVLEDPIPATYTNLQDYASFWSPIDLPWGGGGGQLPTVPGSIV